ncbi:hypothetical protein [Rickettsia endosymbiont of Halotydeus destructor]|uniref:hypothetical protein n=1 Tax=Rickettsia endosymbiont of Halotydeus destructor TaxID=2996754 RepID=UPI003BB19C81
MSKLEDFLVKIGKSNLIPQSTPTPDCLDLGGVDLGSELQSLVEALKEENSITKLVLRNVGNVTNLDLNVLAKFLESEECKVKDFNFSNNGLNATTISLLSDSLAKNKTIEILNLTGNPLRDEGFSTLLQALLQNDTVHTLELYCTGVELKEEVEPAVIEFCKQNNAVKNLAISNDPARVSPYDPVPSEKLVIEPKNATKFMQAIYQKNNLTDLDVRSVKLNDEGVLELIKLLEKHDTKISEISCNIGSIKPETREKLLEAINKNKTLTNFLISQRKETPEKEALFEQIQSVTNRNIEEIKTIAQKLKDFYNLPAEVKEGHEALHKKYLATFHRDIKKSQLHDKESIKFHGELNNEVLDKVDKYINKHFFVMSGIAKAQQTEGVPNEVVCNILKYVGLNDIVYQQPQPLEVTMCLGNTTESTCISNNY